MVNQGDIITVGGLAFPLLVISRDAYNTSGKAIVCPILKEDPHSVLSLYIDCPAVTGYVCCDSLRQLDLISRGSFTRGSLPLASLITVIDMVQSLTDYI